MGLASNKHVDDASGTGGASTPTTKSGGSPAEQAVSVTMSAIARFTHEAYTNAVRAPAARALGAVKSR